MTIFTILKGTQICRYGLDGAKWMESVREVKYSDKTLIRDKADVATVIRLFGYGENVSTINVTQFYWFRTNNHKHPIFAVSKTDVKVRIIT